MIQAILDAGSLTTAVLAVAGGVTALWRWAIRPTIVRVRALHDLIGKELSPNGGMSLVDRVSRIETSLEQVLAWQAEQATRRRAYDTETQDAT